MIVSSWMLHDASFFAVLITMNATHRPMRRDSGDDDDRRLG